MHPEAFNAVREMATTLGLLQTEIDALDIGGQSVNGDTRQHFTGAKWTTIDIADAPGVDIVADATTWVPSREWDLVQSTETLEHVQDWQGILNTAWMALKPGGYLVLTCASTGRRPHGASGAHDPAPGEWYRNVSEEEFRKHADVLFSEVHTTFNPNPGDLYAWAKK